MRMFVLSIFIYFLTGCNSNSVDNKNEVLNDPGGVTNLLYRGADLSYVNEMEDCGANYHNTNGIEQDPFEIFAKAGSNLVRLRLWHNPDWTNYSTFADVKKSIKRAKDVGMDVLLDFHYSDNWADPEKQEIPAAWSEHIDNKEVLGDSLYNYTRSVLEKLDQKGLLPEIVQIGNEINGMILQEGELEWPINWSRNAYLINKGIRAVRDVSDETEKDIEVMLHIAQPENGIWWFKQATENGVTDFDWIGLSYYPLWSEYGLLEVSQPLSELINTYQKRLMIVETAYPWTLTNADQANNILDKSALVDGVPASAEGQLLYLDKLKEIVAGVPVAQLKYS